MDDLKEIIVEGLRNADETGCYNGVYYGNYVNRTKTENIKVGSHQEDHGSYQTETYVDYQYCDCGARRSRPALYCIKVIIAGSADGLVLQL